MKLHEAGALNRLSKKLAPLLSTLVMGKRRIRLLRMFDAYLNFLIGKGAGTGWDIGNEVATALSLVNRPNPVFFDVGGNVGKWSQHMRQKTNAGLIYAFEPQPGCQEAIRQLSLPAFELVGCAMGDRRGTAQFYTSGKTDATGSLHQRSDSYFLDKNYATIEVRVETIDDFMRDHHIDFVDFMKCDIEGHELFAFRGAEQAFAAHKIGALSFEFGSGNLNSKTTFHDFWTFFSRHGYFMMCMTPSQKPVLIHSYYEDFEYYRGATNYIAVSGKHPEAEYYLRGGRAVAA